MLSLFCLSSAKVVLYIAAASLLDQTVFLLILLLKCKAELMPFSIKKMQRKLKY